MIKMLSVLDTIIIILNFSLQVHLIFWSTPTKIQTSPRNGTLHLLTS